jgi:hypothetical protein
VILEGLSSNNYCIVNSERACFHKEQGDLERFIPSESPKNVTIRVYLSDSKRLAEREGFEPPIPVKVCLISSQVHSTGLCHLSVYNQ